MSHKRNKGNRARNRRAKSNIDKAAPSTTTQQRASKKQFATAAIAAVKQVVESLKPFELSRGQRLRTYQRMMSDDAVFSALDSRLSLIQKSQGKGKFKYNKNSIESVRVKDFFEYNMDNLVDQTVSMIGRTAADHIFNGFAPFETVYEAGTDEWADKWKLKKLVYINPLTLNPVEPYEISEDGDEILGLRQDFSAFKNSVGHSFFTVKGRTDNIDWNGKFIDWRKVAYCSYSATIAEPFGQSPLDAAYLLWRSKQLLEDLGMTGATRDMAGIPVLRLPSYLLEEAAKDPSSPAAAQVAQISTSMENMHKGDQSFVILPSDAHNEAGSGALEFDFKLLGVDGGNGNFDIDEMIDKKRKAIFTVLASRHLISGEDGGGSYNLHEGQAGIHAHFAARDGQTLDSMWNRQIFPRLLKLNGWKVSKADMPVWEGAPTSPISMDESGKYFNRVMRSLPAHPDVVNSLLEKLDIDYRVPEGTTPTEIREMTFDFQEESKVGGGDSGTTQSGGQNSDNNAENAS